jgi:hypothetical protein
MDVIKAVALAHVHSNSTLPFPSYEGFPRSDLQVPIASLAVSRPSRTVDPLSRLQSSTLAENVALNKRRVPTLTDWSTE